MILMQLIERELLEDALDIKPREVLFIKTADGKVFPTELKLWENDK